MLQTKMTELYYKIWYYITTKCAQKPKHETLNVSNERLPPEPGPVAPVWLLVVVEPVAGK